MCVNVEWEKERDGPSAFMYPYWGQNDNLESNLSGAHFIMLNIIKKKPGKLCYSDQARLLPNSKLVVKIQIMNRWEWNRHIWELIVFEIMSFIATSINN